MSEVNFFRKYQRRIIPLMDRDMSDEEIDKRIDALRLTMTSISALSKSRTVFDLRLQLTALLHLRLERDLEKFLVKTDPERRPMLLGSMLAAFRSKKNAAWGKEFAERLEAKFGSTDKR